MTSPSHQYLNYLYQNITNNIFKENNNYSSIYGEIFFESFNKLLGFINLNTNDIFIDIGSGIGKVCLQIALNTDVKQILGFEIISDRNNNANTALAKAKLDLPEIFNNKSIDFLNQDFLEFDFSNINTSQNIIAYTCSTCFTEKLLYAIGDKINNNKNISKLLSLRPIPNLTRLKIKYIVDVECSWDTTECYIYE